MIQIIVISFLKLQMFNITRTVLLPKTGVYHIIAVGGGGNGGHGSLGKGGGAVRSGGGVEAVPARILMGK